MKARISAFLLLAGGCFGAQDCTVSRTVRVEVPVEARVDSSVLTYAHRETEWILRSLCATVEWGPGGLVVRILEEPLTADSTADGMGFAMPKFGRGAVFMSRVRAKAGTYTGYITLPILLGCVLAHEIGHLLLGPAHSSDGIMRGEFGKREMQRAEQRHLVFTAADRARLHN